jgi:hypothetical protein
VPDAGSPRGFTNKHRRNEPIPFEVRHWSRMPTPNSGDDAGLDRSGSSRRTPVRVVERDGDVVELSATTDHGEVRIITGIIQEGDDLILSGLHVDGPGAGTCGPRLLRELARDLGSQFGAKRVIVHGGIRTTGANPGRVPRPVVFLVGDS